MVETRFMGSRKAKIWTYLILGLLLVIAILIANFALVNPEAAERGMSAVAGLPPWAFPAIGMGLGVLLYWLGLKIETDWPEFIGSLLIAGCFAWGEIMLGWENFELGGIVLMPYILPVGLFIVLLIFGMAKSK